MVKLTAPDGRSGDFFGRTLALYGTRAVVGSWKSGATQGAAYVFDYDGSGWSQTAALSAPDLGDLSSYGVGLSLWGDRLLVGEPRADSDSGSVYLFEWVGLDWQRTEELTAPERQKDTNFGRSVAIEGDRALVGAAPWTFRPGQGTVWAFERTNYQWQVSGKLVASDGGDGDAFGQEVALSNGRALIGAVGGAYLFEFDGTSWSETEKLTATGEGIVHGSVAIAGDRAVVAGVGVHNRPAVYVFDYDGAAWTESASLIPSDGYPGDQFGADVDLDGDRVVVGAPGDDLGAGAVYVFDFVGPAWIQSAKHVASDGEHGGTAGGDRFGGAVALDNDIALVGAFNDSVADSLQQGSAYVFDLSVENRPPVADAGPDQTVDCTGSTQGTAILLDAGASSDPDGDALSYTWSIEGEDVLVRATQPTWEAWLDLGTTVVGLTVMDGNGGVDTDEVSITILDASPDCVVLRYDEQLTDIQSGIAGGRYEAWRANLIYSSTMIQHLATLPTYWSGDKYLHVNSYSSSLWDRSYHLSFPTPPLASQVENLLSDATQEASDVNIRAVARIMRVFLYHRLTDFYGDVPYSDAGNPEITQPQYDAQEFIYIDLLSELDEAALALAPGERTFGAGDLIYGGHVSGWRRFAYSLMLRLGMRLTKVDPVLAEQWVRKAISGGVMASNDDIAFVPHDPEVWANGNGRVFSAECSDSTGDCTMKLSKFFVDWMLAHGDPRLSVYGSLPNGDTDPAKAKGLPNGFDVSTITDFDPDYDALNYTQPNWDVIGGEDAPTFFQTYAEVELLLAEAAVRGWHSGDPAQHYENGVRAAMEYLALYGDGGTISGDAIDAYVAANPLSGSPAESLEQIGEQVWAAVLMNEYEAYASWRRTGFPTLTPVNYPGNHTNGTIPRRLVYPSGEASNNAEHYMEAVARQGPDLMTTRIWWDLASGVFTDGDTGIPQKSALHAAYPNPFNPTATITYELSHQADVRLRVFNVLGQHVVTLVDGKMKAGRHRATFEAGQLASGVYFFRLQADDFVETRQIVLLR